MMFRMLSEITWKHIWERQIRNGLKERGGVGFFLRFDKTLEILSGILDGKIKRICGVIVKLGNLNKTN